MCSGHGVRQTDQGHADVVALAVDRINLCPLSARRTETAGRSLNANDPKRKSADLKETPSSGRIEPVQCLLQVLGGS
jgi:hypothetical protein